MITVQPVTWDNFRDVLNLKVTKNQESYISSNAVSLAEAYLDMVDADGDPFIVLAIYSDNDVVGFAMAGHQSEEENEYKDDDETCYFICRYMVDEKHQGKGFGRAAMPKLIEHIKTWPRGEAASVYITYKPDNDVARKLYASFGFIETGEMRHGEVVARLKL